jgi:streptogramin lyase
MRFRVRSVIAFVFAFVVTTLASPLTAHEAAAACGTGLLVPQFRGVTINQGLGSYSPAVRGKEGIFRAFLSKPSCAATGDAIDLRTASLAVSLGSVASTLSPTPALVSVFPQIAPFTGSPQVDWVGDPIFVLPSSLLAPASTTAAFTLTFVLTIGYSATPAGGAPTSGTVIFRNPPGTTTGAITLNVDKKSNAIRILVQPMGDATKTFASQFSAAAQSSVQEGLLTLSRIAPVPDGTGSLAGTTTAGVRYVINTGLLDIGPLMTGSPAKFCGGAGNFDIANGVKAKLDQFLQAWNTANPNATADRVLGVVDEAISLGSGGGCAEGMAAVNGKQAWARAQYPAAPTTSMTGAISTMEILHSGGLVPSSRSDPYNPWHSPNIRADASSPNRAYNIAQRASLKSGSKSVMNFTTGFNNNNTLAEMNDFAFWRCLLGGTVTTECTTAASGTVGTAVGVPGASTLVATGNLTINATSATISEASTYFTTGSVGAARTAATASPLQLVQINEGVAPPQPELVRTDPCPVTFANTDHDGAPPPTAPADPNNTNVGSFFCAYPVDVTVTTLIRLVRTNVVPSVVLYERRLREVPAIQTATVSGSEACFTRFNVPTTPGAGVFKITSGPDGNLWFTEFTAGKIGKSTTAGAMTAMTEYDISHWAPTPNLSGPRAFHTATLLPSGKVLVAGGQSSTGLLATAEIYDPETNSWASTGSMAEARRFHTATLLASGMVLVVGGQSPASAELDSAELYDPGTGLWTSVGSLIVGRHGHTATLLPSSGQVLVAGGINAGDLSSAELYSPGTTLWTTTGSMATARRGHTATLSTTDGSVVLVAGGFSGSTALGTSETYFPGSGTWGPAGTMTNPRGGHIAALLADGYVLVAGGGPAGSPIASAEIWNPNEGAWTTTGSLANARTNGVTADVLSNGNVLVVGGQSATENAISSAEIYEPLAGTWSPTSSLGTARSGASQTTLYDGSVLVAGGLSPTPSVLSSAERFEPQIGPFDITTGPDGNLWFTEGYANRIGKINPTSSVITQYIVPTPLGFSFPHDIVTGPDGNVWFTERDAWKISKINPTTGVITQYSVLPVESAPKGITVGPDGNIWFTEYSAQRIGKMKTDGTLLAEYLLPESAAQPREIITGSDGNLWYTANGAGANRIGKVTTSGVFTEYPVSGTGANVHGIALGPDGNIWFAETGDSEIGRITPAGAITEFGDTADANVPDGPIGIWTGSDGNMWFTQSDSLGRLALCGGTGEATVQATFGPLNLIDGRGPADGRLDIFSCVADLCYPLAVALPPDSFDNTSGSASFTNPFSTSQCGTIRFVVNNGIQRSTVKESTFTCETKPPVASIGLPLAGQTFLSYDVIPLKGLATSGGVPITGLQFSMTPTLLGAGSFAAGGTLDLTPPTNGWAAGTYNVTLTATAGSLTATASTTFTVKRDQFHVGRADVETDALSCKLGRPFDPFADWDGDGVPNASDPDVCIAATDYSAVMISFPGRLTPSTSLIVAGMVVPYRSVTAINGTTVRIVSVAGQAVVFTPPNNRGWSVLTIPSAILSRVQSEVPGLVDNKFGAVAFDTAKLIAYLRGQGINNRSVVLEIEGSSTSGWKFRTTVDIVVAL